MCTNCDYRGEEDALFKILKKKGKVGLGDLARERIEGNHDVVHTIASTKCNENLGVKNQNYSIYIS